MYRPEPQTRRGSSRAGPGSSQEPGPSHDACLGQRQALHDAANWLTVLLGHLEMLREDPASARHLELARRAARAAHRLCALPPGTLHAGASIDATRNCGHVIEHLRPFAAARGIALRLEAPGAAPVVADAPGFDDAMMNLVRNAVEATPGPGEVVVRVGHGGPGFVRIRVEDQGPGIPADLRPVLGLPGRTRKQGTDRGIGLSRVKEWLERWGTGIEIGDAREGGASIGFSLAMDAPLESDTPLPEGALRVLLVEDDPAVAEVLKLLLGTDGHKVTIAPDVGSAKTCFNPGRFDLVLCDQNLPDGPGEELASRMVREDPAVVCFLVTGAPESLHSSGDGRLQVLAKPVSRDDLRRAAARATRS